MEGELNARVALSEGEVGDKDGYLKHFKAAVAEPEFGANGQELIKLHVGTVLEATNKVRARIGSGTMDDLTAEQAFHEIHYLHTGEDDPLKKVLATMELGYLEVDAGLSVYGSGVDAAKALDRDPYHKGQYRAAPIVWGSQSRGVLGVDESDVAVFADSFFSAVQLTIQRANDRLTPRLRTPQNVLAYAVTVGTLADIAHFKPDLNGRTSEDYIVWLQRQLLPDDQKPRFLSSHGIRARGAEFVLKPEYDDVYWDVQTRLRMRTQPVLHIRQDMYNRLANGMGLSPNELEQKMPMENDYNLETYNLMRDIRKSATSEFHRLLPVIEDWTLIREEPFLPIVDYFAKQGVDTYTTYTPDQVFKL